MSMPWSGLVRIWENDGRTNDDREKDIVPGAGKSVGSEKSVACNL